MLPQGRTQNIKKSLIIPHIFITLTFLITVGVQEQMAHLGFFICIFSNIIYGKFAYIFLCITSSKLFFHRSSICFLNKFIHFLQLIAYNLTEFLILFLCIKSFIIIIHSHSIAVLILMNFFSDANLF
jgi:hypothetical protein